MFEEFINEIASIVQSTEQRRERSETDKVSFRYAIEYLLKDLWKASQCIPIKECSIHLGRDHYSKSRRYSDTKLNYRQIKAAFDGLLNARLIEVTKKGYYDRIRMEGSLTRFLPRDELFDRLHNLEGHPAITLKKSSDFEAILLRDRIDGHRELIEYDDTAQSEKYRSNLQTINKCFTRHWADLKIKDAEVSTLTERLQLSEDKEPIDLSSRTLVRIFSNGSFKEGGRFYRGWWQNVPSEYRKYITIDEAVTTEYDFSQLSPHMLYFAYNYKMGNEDAYDRVLDGQHRDVVKQAFNAMVQASTQLNHKPDKINLDGLEMDWRELRQRVLEAHKPIQHLFFTGIGNKLQFKDSCIAESVMLQFADQNQVALPIHDSFIMRQGCAGDLEEAMRRAFYDEFQSDIPIKQEVIIERIALFDEQGEPRTEEVTRDDREHSQWYERNTMWLYQRGQ